MIKHGKIYDLPENTGGRAQLNAIRSAVTVGVADAKESVVLHPKVCDIRGSSRKNPQNCVIARTLTRSLHLDAVSVGRSLAYVVLDGLAIRFQLPKASREMVEEFDQRGKASTAPVKLNPPSKSWGIGNRHQLLDTRIYRDHKDEATRPRNTKYDVRTILTVPVWACLP